MRITPNIKMQLKLDLTKVNSAINGVLSAEKSNKKAIEFKKDPQHNEC